VAGAANASGESTSALTENQNKRSTLGNIRVLAGIMDFLQMSGKLFFRLMGWIRS
jgi:hypothetical protein